MPLVKSAVAEETLSAEFAKTVVRLVALGDGCSEEH